MSCLRAKSQDRIGFTKEAGKLQNHSGLKQQKVIFNSHRIGIQEGDIHSVTWGLRSSEAIISILGIHGCHIRDLTILAQLNVHSPLVRTCHMAPIQLQQKLERYRELYEYLRSTEITSSHRISRNNSTVYGTEYR